MKTIFHIGHHKTGTTSLQAFLAVNWVRLLRSGVLSPWVESQGAAWTQAQLLWGEDADPSFLSANIREPHNALAFRMLAEAVPERRMPPLHPGTPASKQMLLAIQNQIETFEPETTVFVSEVMSHFGPSAPQLIDDLAGRLGWSDTILHVSLRRPDDHLVSWRGQQLRFGAPLPPLSDPDTDPLQGLHFDYRAVIEPWLDRLPGIEPHIRSHRAVMAAGGSIGDFFAQSDLEMPDDTVEVPSMNESLPRALFPLLRLVNNAVPRPAARTLASDLLDIAPELDLAQNAEIEFFGADRRAQMAERFAPIHDWLASVAGAPLFDDLDDILRVRPVSEDDALDRVLASLTDEHVETISNPDVRAFVKGLKSQR